MASTDGYILTEEDIQKLIELVKTELNKKISKESLHYDETIAIVNCNVVNASTNEVFPAGISEKVLDRYSIFSVVSDKVIITIQESGFYKISMSALFGSAGVTLKMYVNSVVYTLGTGNKSADVQKISTTEMNFSAGDIITFSFTSGSGVCAIWPISVVRIH